MKTTIAWTDESWNYIAARNRATGRRGWFCTKQTGACRNCYAEAMNRRLGNGLEYLPKNLGQIEWFLDEKKLNAPLGWRKPRKVFVNSMTDFFHPAIPDGFRDAGFRIMAQRPDCFFQILTKQPDAMREYMGESEWGRNPLPNVALMVSVGNQMDYGRFMPVLLHTPAIMLGLSVEPMLGRVDFGSCLPLLDWVIFGGESGPGARPCDVRWIRDGVRQCRAAGVPVFVKQLGPRPYQSPPRDGSTGFDLKLRNSKGEDMAEWPEDLRVREWPRRMPENLR